MFTNIDSLLRAGLLQKYSFICLLLSILCIGVDCVSVLLFCLNPNFNDEIQMRPEYVLTIRLNGQGIWCGILGITIAFVCNILAIEKNKEMISLESSEFHFRIQQKILNTEAGLFIWTILVSLISFCGVLMSGYSCIRLIAADLLTSQIEQLVFLLYAVETLLILGICLTTFTLAIYAFNVLLPLYYSSFIRDLYTGALCTNKSEKWKESPNCEFSQHSFSGSSIQFGTIETLSERSIPALTKKLSIKRQNDNCPLPQTLLPSNRHDLIVL